MASWRQNKIVGIVAGIILVIAISLIVINNLPEKEFFLLKCGKCGTIFIKKISLPTRFPIMCPKGHKAGYKAEALILPNGEEKIILEKDLPEDLRKFKVITKEKIDKFLGR